VYNIRNSSNRFLNFFLLSNLNLMPNFLFNTLFIPTFYFRWQNQEEVSKECLCLTFERWLNKESWRVQDGWVSLSGEAHSSSSSSSRLLELFCERDVLKSYHLTDMSIVSNQWSKLCETWRPFVRKLCRVTQCIHEHDVRLPQKFKMYI